MSDDRWSLEASNILEPAKNWQVLGLYADGCSKSTRERLLERIPIKECAFNAFSQALGINPDEVVQTDLSLQLARRVRGDFEYLIWRRLLNAPPLEILLTELIEFVCGDRKTELATTTDNLITQLLHHLKKRRCLLILDNVESILQSKTEIFKVFRATRCTSAGVIVANTSSSSNKSSHHNREKKLTPPSR